MATALAIAQAVVARAYSIDGIRITDYVRGGMSYCQQFAGNFWEEVMGRATPNSYSSAKAAMNASGALHGDYNAAPPGAYHFFDYSVYGHVGVSLGSGLMVSATGWGTNALAHLGKHVYIHRVADYAAHLNYRGWSMQGGARESLVGKVTDANAPQLAGNQRRVKPNADANLRVAPSTESSRTVVKANTIVNGKGYVTSQLAGGQPSGSDKWVVVDGGYLHVSVFTDGGLHDLPDLGVIAPPKPVVRHVVTVEYRNLTADVKTHEVEDGKLFPEPAHPETNGSTFEGWFDKDGNFTKPFDFAQPITRAVNLVAVWELIPDPEPEPEPGEPVDPKPEPEPEPEPEPQPNPTKPVGLGGIIAIVVTILGAIAAAIASVIWPS